MPKEKTAEELIAEAEENTNPEAPELTEVEQAAYDKGWRPEADYEGDSWIGAEEFVARAPLYEGLSKANKKIKRMEGVVKQFAEHNKKVEQTAYDRALADIKAERKEALKDEDYDKALALEDKQKDLEQDAPAPEQVESAIFTEWREDNEWFGDDKPATLYANAYGSELRQANPSMTEADLYDAVAKEVKTTFPALFSKKLPNRGNASGAQGAGKAQGGNKFNKLTAEEQRLCKELVSMGVFKNEEEYIKQLSV